MTVVRLPYKVVVDAVQEARQILAEYIEPGPRNPEQTLNRLLGALDDRQLIDALRQQGVKVSPMISFDIIDRR